MNSKKNVIFQYILLAIFITSCIMLLKKSDFLKSIQDPLNLRDLANVEAREYSCDKAGSRLLDKYSGDFNEEIGEAKESLNDAQQAIVDFARDRKYSNIKPYLKRVAIYIVFLCLVVIFIGLWISYWSCCCCNSCLFSTTKGNSKFLPFLFYIISTICFLLVIIFSIIILCLTNPFFRRVNGLFCSSLILLDHLINGFGTHYPQHTSEWDGLNHVIDRFNVSNEMMKTIDNDYINEAYNEAYENCKTETNCDCNPDELEEGRYYWYDFYSSSYIIFDIPTQISKMTGGLVILDETKIDVGEDIYDFLHDYANRHIKRICIAIFVLTLIIGVLGLIFLSLYYFFKTNIYRIAYIVIWNLSMLFMILAILVSVVFGVLGYIAKDGVQVIQYALSSQNINGDDPIFFKSRNTFVSSLIEECANDDGDFLNSIEEKILSPDDDLDSEFQEELNELKNSTCSADTKKSLIDYYTALYNGTIITLNATASLIRIKCRFAKNDKNIILNELNSAGKRATVLSTFQFLVGILLGISVLFGILLVHKYKFSQDNNEIREITVNQNHTNESQGNFNY